MPHAVLKLYPGANTQQTPALNENSGVSQTQLVRWFPDAVLGALIQKLGGWSRFFPTPMAAIVRALWAWEDLDANSHLAVGTTTVPGQLYAQISVITGGTQKVITPTQAQSNNMPPSIAATNGSASLIITDTTTTGINNADSVYIATQIAVGGIVLFGLYPCDPDGYSGASSYSVYSRDILGNLLPATSTNAPVLPTFGTTSGSNLVNVELPAFPYGIGDTFPVLISTLVGGVTLFGDYIIVAIVDLNNFTIQIPTIAPGSAAVGINGGNALYIYNTVGIGTSGATPINGTDWTMDNFGEDLILCPTSRTSSLPPAVPYQPIYAWNPNQTTATVIPQAPPVNDGAFVSMPSRQIVAWGSTETGIQDPLLISWCDVNNFNQWIPLTTNQAGNYRIPKGSKIVAGMQGPQQGVIWTDIDVWVMQYIGTPLVFGFNEIGSGCGLIGRKAACFLNGIGYWMGFSQFYTLGADGVQPIECPVWDVVFQNLNLANTTKIRAAVNSRFGEISWFYPSANGTGEVDSYVKYNVYLNIWDYGTLGRTAWVDQSVLGPPIGSDPTSLYLYQHETSNDADGAAMTSYFQTGYYIFSEGDWQTFVDLVWPDMKWGFYDAAQTATIQISFYVTGYPGDTPRIFGPYSVTQATKYFNTRFRGRLVSIRVESSDLGSWWRIGALRYRWAQDGKFG